MKILDKKKEGHCIRCNAKTLDTFCPACQEMIEKEKEAKKKQHA